MQIVRDRDALRAALRGLGPRALVPTMGALHAGHAALLEAARASGAAVVASVFVNPAQFASAADANAYPRDEAADLAILEAHGCALAWLPTAGAMYPAGFATTVAVEGPALGFEGAERPGHFAGVATVVSKLFAQIQPVTAYFGEKDWQQVQVVRRMARDLDHAVSIVGVPTVRDPDGLAASSRNRFLSLTDRALAPALPRALRQAALALRDGQESRAALEIARKTLEGVGFVLGYVALVDGPTLRPLDRVQPGARLIAAARLGTVRLLDNLAVD